MSKKRIKERISSLESLVSKLFAENKNMKSLLGTHMVNTKLREDKIN